MLDVKALLTKLASAFDVIGTAKADNQSKSLSSSTSYSSLGVKESMDAGVWHVSAAARFTGSSNGYRSLYITCDDVLVETGYVHMPSSGSTAMYLEVEAAIASASPWELDLKARQNSGSSMTVNWYYRAVRIK